MLNLSSFLLFFFLCCSSLLLLQTTPSSALLTFTPRTLTAPWSPRWDSNIEWYPFPLTTILQNGTSRTWPGRLMILQGNGDGGGAAATNDVWASPDLGATWYLIAGIAPNGQAYNQFAQSSFRQALGQPATGVDSRARIYRISGQLPNGIRPQASAWVSTTGGQSWVNMLEMPNARPFAPGRDRASLMIDSLDHLYLIGGQVRQENNGMTDTAFKSTDQGLTWQQIPSTPWTPRGSGLFLQHFSRALGRDILTYMTGWDGRLNVADQGLYNEVWISSDRAMSWERVRTNFGGNAPFSRRDAANGEITADGTIILVGGQTISPSGVYEALNDIWVSLDGGYQWGLCNQDAPFSDRRNLMTMLDAEGFLYVAGGQDYAIGRSFNDVWRSSFSFNDPATVVRECNVPMPACGPGLACWPGETDTTFLSNNTVTCPRVRQCAGLPSAYMDFDLATRAASFSPRYYINVEYLPKTITYRNPAGVQRTVTNPLILTGSDLSSANGLYNDVWCSSDRGLTWELIAGQGAFGNAALTSYTPVWAEATGMVDSRNNYIIRVGGFNNANGQPQNDVWSTSDGIQWQRMAAVGLSPRHAPSLISDDTGKIWLIGGIANGAPLGDMLSSVNLGQSWQLVTARIPWMATGRQGRAKGVFFHRFSRPLNRDILWYGTGWDGVNLFNDMWASSDGGVSWTAICASAPFRQRDSAGGEVTRDGLLVVVGGQAPQFTENDMWVSADGGYTWGACATETFWTDRRDASTVLDGDGYFYVIGGRANFNPDTPKYNDVYRTRLSLNNLADVSVACGIQIPACGAGLSCWPGAAGTVVDRLTGQVTCPALQACTPVPTPPRTVSSTAGARSSSAAVVPLCVRDPCNTLCPPDPLCGNYEEFSSSTGIIDVATATGLSMGAIIAIVLIVILAVGVAAWYYNSRFGSGKQAQPVALETSSTPFLSSAETSSTSTSLNPQAAAAF